MPSLRFRQAPYNINLWIMPLKMSFAAVALFALTMIPDMLAAYHVIHLPNWFSMGGIDDARAILSAMLGCVSTVLALIFSVTLLVLSMVANLFGPRLLYRFVQDWVMQATIGLFMAAFIYIFLVFLVTHSDPTGTFIPQTSLITSWFLVLAAFSFLVYYSHRVAFSIQNPDAVARIVEDLRRAVERENAQHRQLGFDSALQKPFEVENAGTLDSRASGYMQEIDHASLLAAAHREDAFIEVLFRPGQFVLKGEPLARISPASHFQALAPLIEEGIVLGRHRILTQDLEFGIAQIVEIAIRALSPAVNDTFTGVACTDLLGEALIILAEVPQHSSDWYGEDGSLRLRVRPLLIARLIKQAFDQVRQAASGTPAVSIRLLATIGRLASKLERQEDRTALIEQADAVLETATLASIAGMDREDITAAWRKTRELLASSTPTSQ